MQPDNAISDSKSLVKLGMQAAAEGNAAAALDYFDRAAKAGPNRATAYVKAGNLLRKLDRLDEAEARYRAALAVAPESTVAVLGLAQTARKRNDADASLRFLKQALEIEPDNIKALLELGTALRKLSRLDEARAIFEKILEKNPSNTRAIDSLKRIDNARDGEDDIDEPEFDSDDETGGSAAAHAIREARSKGDGAAACECLRNALASEPHNVEVLFELAVTLRRLGRSGEAANTYRRIVALDSRNVRAHLALGFLARAHRDEASALTHFQAASEIDPDNVQTQLYVAEILAARNRKEEADAVVKAVLAKAPKDAKVLASLGAIAKKTGNWTDAAASLERAAAAEPSKTSFRLQLGRAYCDLLEPDKAEKAFRSVLETNPDNVEAMVGLGEVARLRGDSDAALEHFESASKLSPSNVNVRAGIRALKVAAGDFDWRSEIEDAISIVRNSGTSASAQITAATILVEHGITEFAKPALSRLEAQSPDARQLILAIREIERMGLAQQLKADGAASDLAEDQLDALKGFHEKPVAGSDTLLIVFAGRNNRVWMTFSLLHRILRKTGASVVYVRDLRETWYTRGVVGLGNDYEKTVAAFGKLAKRYGAKRVLTLGNCVGCLGALRYGLSLGAKGVLGIAPNVRPVASWKPEYAARVKALEKLLPKGHKDMHTQYLEAGARPGITLIYGEQCEPDASDAKFMTDVPGVKIAGVPEATTHDSVKDLLVRGLLEPLLREFVTEGDVSPELLSRITQSKCP